MSVRSSGRWIAPLALVVALVAILAVLNNHGAGSGGSTTTSTPTVTQPHKRRIPRFYTVKKGDVLSSIAARSGVPLARIEELNPKISPQLLQRGQRLKLR